MIVQHVHVKAGGQAAVPFTDVQFSSVDFSCVALPAGRDRRVIGSPTCCRSGALGGFQTVSWLMSTKAGDVQGAPAVNG